MGGVFDIIVKSVFRLIKEAGVKEVLSEAIICINGAGIGRMIERQFPEGLRGSLQAACSSHARPR